MHHRIDGICPSCKQEGQFTYVGDQKDIDGSVLCVLYTCQSCGSTISKKRIRWIEAPTNKKTFFDKLHTLVDVFGNMTGILQDLDAEIGTGSDLDYHLCEDGFADRIKAALARAKVVLSMEGD